jgi:uncharacterized membrane protein
MTKTRLEAFSDAVIAIVMTIMVLELRLPKLASGDSGWHALHTLAPEFLTYLLSFVFLAIYWNNHHHLIHTVKRVNGKILWANMHLLFWLSLTPAVTAWLGKNHLSSVPVAVYGIVLLLAALAYYVLQTVILSAHGPDTPLKSALGNDLKGKISPVFYLTAIVFAFVSRWVSIVLYVLVALIWLIPDRRIESLYQGAGDA